MFQTRKRQSSLSVAFSMAALVYHATVRSVRKSHGNALIGLLQSVLQTVIMVGAFYVMFSLLGLRASAIRGDFLLYIMSGIFLFLTHTKALGAVVSSDGPAAPMMQHEPMNTAISISSAALASLYIQVLSVSLVLVGYHVAFTPVEIHNMPGALAMLLLAWFSGVSIGLVFLAIKPWMPGFVKIAATVYARANVIASGKMFVANMLPGYMLMMFDWNPLFHCIDQARGFIFLNYDPRYSSTDYPLYVCLGLVLIGLMGEFYTRRHASISWAARR